MKSELYVLEPTYQVNMSAALDILKNAFISKIVRIINHRW